MIFRLSILFAAFAVSLAYDEVCYDDLGCFTNAPPYGNTNARNFNGLPDSPEKINARFYLDTRSQKGREVYYDDISDLMTTSFDSSKMTRFIIHGYTENGDVQWMQDMSDNYLAVADENVIRVGWFGGAAQLNYVSSSLNTQVVGAEVGVFIENMKAAFRMSSSKFHCTGHSLGAHTCGYISKQTRIGRTTGLDPAGPYFDGTPSEVRLDPSDADFVDVIHSDAVDLVDFGFGTSESSGDIDFWPNGGRYQPGCDQNAISTIIGVDGVNQGTKDFVSCNHIRAIKFYSESITTSCKFTSYPCNGYNDFLAGKCDYCDGTGCPEMGYYADLYKNQNGYIDTELSTNALAPFCEYMTDVAFALGDNGKNIEGMLFLTIYSSYDNTGQEQLGGQDAKFQLTPGGYYSGVMYFDTDPGPISYVKVLWEKTSVNVGADYITVDYIQTFIGPTQTLLTFCGDTSVKMYENTRYKLNKC